MARLTKRRFAYKLAWPYFTAAFSFQIEAMLPHIPPTTPLLITTCERSQKTVHKTEHARFINPHSRASFWLVVELLGPHGLAVVEAEAGSSLACVSRRLVIVFAVLHQRDECLQLQRKCKITRQTKMPALIDELVEFVSQKEKTNWQKKETERNVGST